MVDRTADWLEWRARGIGASDIAGILGISPWSSPYAVWSSKVLNVTGGDIANAEAMRWGKALEGAIIAETERRLGISVQAEQPRRVHPRKPWALATPDAEYMDPESETGVLEVKTSSEFHWTQVPAYYEAQVQWQLEVCQLKKAWLACLHNGRKLSLWRIEANADVAGKMLDIAERFWLDHVCTGEPPMMDGSEGTTESIRARYDIPDPDSIVEIDNMVETVAQLRQTRADIRTLEGAKAQLENEIKAAMETAETATIDGNVVATWKRGTQKRVDLDELREKFPDVAREVTHETQPRRFLLKDDKANVGSS